MDNPFDDFNEDLGTDLHTSDNPNDPVVVLRRAILSDLRKLPPKQEWSLTKALSGIEKKYGISKNEAVLHLKAFAQQDLMAINWVLLTFIVKPFDEKDPYGGDGNGE